MGQSIISSLRGILSASFVTWAGDGPRDKLDETVEHQRYTDHCHGVLDGRGAEPWQDERRVQALNTSCTLTSILVVELDSSHLFYIPSHVADVLKCFCKFYIHLRSFSNSTNRKIPTWPLFIKQSPLNKLNEWLSTFFSITNDVEGHAGPPCAPEMDGHTGDLPPSAQVQLGGVELQPGALAVGSVPGLPVSR